MTGSLLVVLGVAAALAPMVGPELGLAIGSKSTFDITDDQALLSVIPGVAVAVGGLLLAISADRAVALLGAALALAGGIWLVTGPLVSRLWMDHGGLLGVAGHPYGSRSRQTIEILVFFNGIGALIAGIAGFATGRLTLAVARKAAEQDADRAAPAAPAPAPPAAKPASPQPAAQQPRRVAPAPQAIAAQQAALRQRQALLAAQQAAARRQPAPQPVAQPAPRPTQQAAERPQPPQPATRRQGAGDLRSLARALAGRLRDRRA